MRPLIAGFIALATAAAVGTILLASGNDQGVAATPVAPTRHEQVDQEGVADNSALASVAGPQQAALRAVALNGELVTAGHFSRRDLIQSVATPQLAEALNADASAQILDFQFEVNTSADFEILQAPVTSQVRELEPGRAEVTIWSVVVVSSAEFGIGREAWQTSRLELVLADGVWLVDVWDTQPGPAPAPSSDLVFAGPGELIEPMRWTPVVDGEVG